MEKVLEFFGSTKGWILALMGTGSGIAPEVLEESAEIHVLHPMQMLVLCLTAIATFMTIISYLYKFFMFIRNKCKQ